MADEVIRAEDDAQEGTEHVVEEGTEEREEVRTAPAPPRQREAVPARSAPRRGGGNRNRRFRPRRKVCSFCVDKVQDINYKEIDTLRRFMDGHAKIIPRRKTGTCAKHQRRLAVAIKRARHMALLPFTAGRSPYD